MIFLSHLSVEYLPYGLLSITLSAGLIYGKHTVSEQKKKKGNENINILPTPPFLFFLVLIVLCFVLFCFFCKLSWNIFRFSPYNCGVPFRIRVFAPWLGVCEDRNAEFVLPWGWLVGAACEWCPWLLPGLLPGPPGPALSMMGRWWKLGCSRSSMRLCSFFLGLRRRITSWVNVLMLWSIARIWNRQRWRYTINNSTDFLTLSYFLRLKTVEIPGINILMFSSPEISRVYLLLLAYMLAFSLWFIFSLLGLSCPNCPSGPLWNYVSLTPEHIGMENCWRAAQSTEHVPATQVSPLSSVLPALRIKGFFTLLYLNKQINKSLFYS